jgi:hypothetical protein
MCSTNFNDTITNLPSVVKDESDVNSGCGYKGFPY